MIVQGSWIKSCCLFNNHGYVDGVASGKTMGLFTSMFVELEGGCTPRSSHVHFCDLPRPLDGPPDLQVDENYNVWLLEVNVARPNGLGTEDSTQG